MSLIIKNNATTTLSADISSTAVSVAVTDGTVFPALGGSDYFYATIQSTGNAYEIVKVTALATNTLTVVRAQEDTIAIPFTSGSRIELRVTKKNLDDLLVDALANVLLI